MLRFDDTENNERLAKIHKEEEEGFLQIMATKHGIPYADLSVVSIDIAAVGLIREDVARLALIAVFAIANKKIKVGLFSPTQSNTKEVLASLAERGYIVEQFLVSHASLEKVWERYREISGSIKSKAGMVDISEENIEEIVERFTNIAAVTTALQATIIGKDSRIISKILSVVLAGAIGVHASDIHIEPAEDEVHIRYRIDGILHEIATFPNNIYRSFSSRLKLLAGLKLNVGSESQDGRFSIKIKDIEIEMRVSVIPGAYGEGVVMRILNPQSLNVTLEDLGMSPRLLAIVDKEIHKPHGMILNTGPTGSGKTTTLYSFLKRIFSPEIKMMTIEDPIEFHMKGVSQTQVEAEKGYTFLEGLRAAMRQDPDVIMIGEIRDGETAKVAINAALTGHMVFSTLHTNTAAGAIPRLIDIGVTPKIIGSSLTVALAQRLARKLCVECKKEDTPNEWEKKIIDEVAFLIKGKVDTVVQTEKVWRAVGCVKCNNTGYKGRVGIFEAVLMNSDIEALLDGIPSEREIREVAKKQGILTMREDGIEKILAGATSFDEVARVVDLESAE
ncbi:MAG: type II/IV secretion system protein [Candidatus Yonathbacteria bacterium]|nr:type II/IV secretion system protein [Candidatus Yonathbacteria bacterium]